MNSQDVETLFSQFEKITAMVIGDAMVDSYLWGKVERVSPEAPIPIVSVTNKENRLGGAANVSLNLQALGAPPLLFSVIGDDEQGRRFRKLMEKQPGGRGHICRSTQDNHRKKQNHMQRPAYCQDRRRIDRLH